MQRLIKNEVDAMNEPLAPAGSAAEALSDVEIERAKFYGRAAKSPRTQHEYAREVAHFEAWCARRGLVAMPAPPPVVARYVASLAGDLKIASIRRRVVAISQKHQERGLEPPTAHKLVREVLAGIARTHGSPQKQKSALGAELLEAALGTIDLETLWGQRDRAILLLGFAGAFRRSELAALNVADLTFDRRGVTVVVPRSKTDQAGVGRQIGIPYVKSARMCAVTAVREWLRAADISYGPVFRTFALPRGRGDRANRLQEQRIDGRDVARILQHAITLAGVEGDFAAHSLRAGFVTSAAQKKIPEVDIMRVTGHRSVAVLRGYVRRATLFDDAPLSTILG